MGASARRLRAARGLAAQKRVLGNDHPDTLRTARNLGTALSSLCEFDEAERLLGDTLALLRRVAGEHHPSTVGTANALQALQDTVRLLSPGSRVRVKGLQKAPALNGVSGTVQARDRRKPGRVTVQLDTTPPKVYSLKLGNLETTDGQPILRFMLTI